MWKLFKDIIKVKNREINYKNKINNKEDSLKLNIKKLEKREVKEIDTSLFSLKYKIDYNSLLNEEQKKALVSIEGQYLVIAGAGSGKTRTMVYRTVWLIENGVEENKILMITFTRKASMEMKERLNSILKKDNIKVVVTTFHSFCAKLIYKYKTIFELKKFKILEENEVEAIFNKLIKKYNLNKKYKDIEMLKNTIEKIENQNIKTDDIYREKDIIEDINLLKSEYKKYKKIKNVYEYDDLIKIVVKKLKENKEFLQNLRDKINYIIVDEYQDSNFYQRELLKLLTGENGNLMVVGDDYQSIYGFRGADYENILKFGEDFPKAKLIKLERNYRSSEEIITYTNRIAKKLKYKYNKNIYGLSRSVEKVHKNSFRNIEKENEYICKKILDYSKNMVFEEMAILYRNKYNIKTLEKSLKDYNIPYHKKEEKKQGVALYTIHASKGLEWEVVFIPVLLDGVFPSDLNDIDLEEETRLYYVACSRAKTHLYLSYPNYFYEKLGFYNKKSRFLDY